MKKLVMSIVLTLALACAAVAPRVASATSHSPAGCGVGPLLFGYKSTPFQIFAATTNALFFNQTIGILIGTLDCEQSGSGKPGAIMFIERNRPALAKDIARGSGETIATLSLIGGCAGPEALGAVLQSHFEVIFPDVGASDHDVSKKIVEVMEVEKTLACGELAES